MFQSYEFIGSLGIEGWRYRIVDTEFVVEDIENTIDGLGFMHAIINTYKKRNLNVAANVALAIKCFGFMPRNQTNLVKRIIALIPEHKDELMKYIALL